MIDREKVIKNLQGVYNYLKSFENTAKMAEWVADALELLKESEVKTYGKLYRISAEAVSSDRYKLEQELYADIAKCLIENGVLATYSGETIPGYPITYGWKLKGQAVKLDE